MTNTFIISMDDSCFLNSMGWCFAGYGIDRFRRCDGELKYRPYFCPLKKLRECKSSDYDRKMVYVEE